MHCRFTKPLYFVLSWCLFWCADRTRNTEQANRAIDMYENEGSVCPSTIRAALRYRQENPVDMARWVWGKTIILCYTDGRSAHRNGNVEVNWWLAWCEWLDVCDDFSQCYKWWGHQVTAAALFIFLHRSCWLSTQHTRQWATTLWWVVQADRSRASSVRLLVQGLTVGNPLPTVHKITASTTSSTLPAVTWKDYSKVLTTTIMLAGWQFMYNICLPLRLTVLPPMPISSKATLLHRKPHTSYQH